MKTLNSSKLSVPFHEKIKIYDVLTCKHFGVNHFRRKFSLNQTRKIYLLALNQVHKLCVNNGQMGACFVPKIHSIDNR